MSLLDYLQRDPECRSLAEGAVHAVAPLLEEPDPEPLLRTLDAWALELAALNVRPNSSATSRWFAERECSSRQTSARP